MQLIIHVAFKQVSREVGVLQNGTECNVSIVTFICFTTRPNFEIFIIILQNSPMTVYLYSMNQIVNIANYSYSSIAE